MKKIKLILLTFLAISALTACSAKETHNNTAGGNDGIVTDAPSSTHDTNDADNAIKDAGDTAGDAVDGAGDVVGDAVDGAGNVVGDAVEGAGDVVGDVVDGAGDAAGNAVDDAGNAMTDNQ